jgi:membrane protease YdiL (CAAX protease family)
MVDRSTPRPERSKWATSEGSDHRLHGAARVGVWIAVVGLASGLPASAAVAAGRAVAALVLPPIVVALLVGAAVVFTAVLRPLLLVLAASVAGLWMITLLVLLVGPGMTSWPLAIQILVVNGAKVVPLAGTLAVIWHYRPSRRHLALRVGDWQADSGLRIGRHRIDWRWIGPTVAIVVCGGTITSAAGAFSPAGLSAALVWLPVYTIAAIVNASAEELMFRHAVNATIGPLMSQWTRITLTSLYFGVTHINGTPSGPVGVLLSAAFGVALALAIEHTRGFCWNWTMHFLADMAIFFALIAATTPT